MNYKDEELKPLTKSQLVKIVQVTPAMVEKHEVERIGGMHLTKNNGPDGILPNGTELEIKSQRWEGTTTLRGRGKFGSPTEYLYNAKVESNELITVVGYHPDSGEMYYRFNFDFAAIADSYWHAVEMNWGNYDMVTDHYDWHESFTVDYIVNEQVLERDSEIFQPKFLNFLYDNL